jgi:hypothetical protein
MEASPPQDVAATLGELERKLRELEHELEHVGRGGETDVDPAQAGWTATGSPYASGGGAAFPTGAYAQPHQPGSYATPPPAQQQVAAYPPPPEPAAYPPPHERAAYPPPLYEPRAYSPPPPPYPPQHQPAASAPHEAPAATPGLPPQGHHVAPPPPGTMPLSGEWGSWPAPPPPSATPASVPMAGPVPVVAEWHGGQAPPPPVDRVITWQGYSTPAPSAYQPAQTPYAPEAPAPAEHEQRPPDVAAVHQSVGDAQGQLEELLRFRDHLVSAANQLVAELTRVLADLGAHPPTATTTADPGFAVPAAEPQPVPPPVHRPDDTVLEGNVAVEAGPFTDLAILATFEQALTAVPGVREVHVRALADGHARVDVELDRPLALAAELRHTMPVVFTTIEAGNGRLVLAIEAGRVPGR